MLHKKFNQDLPNQFFMQKIDSCEVCLPFKLIKILSAAPKNNPRTHSPQQNKKAVLTTAVYFKVTTPVRSQRLALRLLSFSKKSVSSIKHNK